MTKGQDAQRDIDYKITDEMIEAGVYEAREHPLGGDLRDLVTSVYAIMRAVEDQTKASASSIIAVK